MITYLDFSQSLERHGSKNIELAFECAIRLYSRVNYGKVFEMLSGFIFLLGVFLEIKLGCSF